MQQHAATGRTYQDGTPVPFPSYRCPSTAKAIRSETSTYTHACKSASDHDGPHRCVCGTTWDRVDDLLKGMSA